ncbi:MAG: hypothetical protein ACD_72C00503G0002 [uncultured bacterium]|nr:MAG: hypothetical protein ACD_72C00503G0002 [uncultured bacterium]
MISLRARIFIVISLIVLFILGVSLFLLVRAKKINLPFTDQTTTTPIAAEETVPGIGPNGEPAVVTALPVTALEAEKRGVQQLAKIFFERLNSYSSESQFNNVRDVKEMVTASYWKELSAKLPSISAATGVQVFSSKIVTVYSVKLVSWNGDSATVDMQMKVSETKNGTTIDSNQEAVVTMVKQNGSWLVDKYQWVK